MKQNKELTAYLNELIGIYNISCFDDLKDFQQDQAIALAIDLEDEIVLSQRANYLLARFLAKHDRDDEIEFLKEMRNVSRETYGYDIDFIINELRDEKLHEGLRPYTNLTNGETVWRM